LGFEEAKIAFEKLRDKIINENPSLNLSIEKMALGFLKVANEKMAQPIKNLTQGKGFDPREHVLSVFGGAGAQHSCDIARMLGI
jgi:5-oxoprolinase (ATP-hydrolysing)